MKAALEHENCTIEDFKALLSPAAEPFLEQMARRASAETSKHFGNTVYLFTPLYIANYCENYCVYCGFNCYNHIKRMKLSICLLYTSSTGSSAGWKSLGVGSSVSTSAPPVNSRNTSSKLSV